MGKEYILRKEQARRARAAERELRRAAKARDLYSTETRIACPEPDCKAQPGEKCRSIEYGTIAVWAHVERKRAHARLIRIETADAVLVKHVSFLNTYRLATEIVDALAQLNKPTEDA